MDAQGPLHRRTSPLAPTQAEPSITVSKSNHQMDDAPSSRHPPACPVQAIVDAYHEAMPNNPRVRVMNDARARAIKARWRQASRLSCKPFEGGYETQTDGLAKWRVFFQTCAHSPFLTGQVPAQAGRPPFFADIDFLMKPSGFTHCLENKYHRESV
ncbi:hypothetical protein [Burkholderia sp. Bp9143]|uniref:hypothetical protein n=1 Tax=Burkholderia sp. Bp9143 TaxID=2184574 RepID=UPI000F5B05F5|nr:hypothetical protein [Burkholderia sp. Bp9143]